VQMNEQNDDDNFAVVGSIFCKSVLCKAERALYFA
jgi:hypothetical protein